MATTGFDLVTPTATLFSGQAEMIVCKSVDGEIAFLAEHEPFIGALDPCLVRIVGPEGAATDGAAAGADSSGPSGPEIRVAVHGGFVEVKDNHVIMLADIAQRPEEIDVAQAQADEADASTRASAGAGPGDVDKAAETDLKWAQVRLEAVS
jgi:F-type H+-transporting ATPase subunit epsilon